MKILVTGGAGFIGSNLVDALIKEGHDVVIIDDLSTGRKENINKKATFYNIDVRDPGIRDIFNEHKFDVVNHHAAQIDVRRSVKDPVIDADINILGLLNLLKYSVGFNVKRFINISSGGVIYGKAGKIPTKENSPYKPISPYGISKLSGEYYVKFYGDEKGLEYVNLRYSNVYGERQDPRGEAGVISIFSKMMLEGSRPVIYGNGKQTRDFVYVGDVVRANLKAIERGNTLSINIGTGKETSINKLYSLLSEITDFDKKPRYQRPRPGELKRSCLDIRKARKYLHWEPKYSLEEGLKKTVEWIKSTLS